MTRSIFDPMLLVWLEQMHSKDQDILAAESSRLIAKCSFPRFTTVSTSSTVLAPTRIGDLLQLVVRMLLCSKVCEIGFGTTRCQILCLDIDNSGPY